MSCRRLLTSLLCLMVLAAGCGDDGPAKSERPVTALIVDISSSTSSLREPGGQFEQDWLTTVKANALKRGTLWASVADESTVAHNTWLVRGDEFTPTVKDNPKLADAELEKRARDLQPKARAIVGRGGGGGSDLLGALQMAARLFRDYPDRPRALVLLTDGGITVGSANLVRDPPTTERERKRFLAAIRRTGELPDLTGGSGTKVRVWIGGLGHDPQDKLGPGGAQAVIEFWRELIPAAGGDLVTEDSSLRLTDFPE